MQMQPMNPQYRIGQEPEFVGQTLNVPKEWAPKLVAAGYTVQQDPIVPSPPSPAPPSGPPALLTPPKAIGCGTHAWASMSLVTLSIVTATFLIDFGAFFTPLVAAAGTIRAAFFTALKPKARPCRAIPTAWI